MPRLPRPLCLLACSCLTLILLTAPAQAAEPGQPQLPTPPALPRLLEPTPLAPGPDLADQLAAPPPRDRSLAWIGLGMEAAYLAAHAADWAQTRNLARNPERFHEINRILGRRPHKDKIDLYFGSTALLHMATAWLLPNPYRSIFQAGTLSLELGVIDRNARLGVKVRF